MNENLNPQEHDKVEYNERNSILVKDLIIAIARTERGPAIYSDFKSRQEMKDSMVELNKEIVGKMAVNEITQKKSIVIQPRGRIMGFARKIFRR